jgi:hypothetical protein
VSAPFGFTLPLSVVVWVVVPEVLPVVAVGAEGSPGVLAEFGDPADVLAEFGDPADVLAEFGDPADVLADEPAGEELDVPDNALPDDALPEPTAVVTVAEDAAGQPSVSSSASWVFASKNAVSSVVTVARAPITLAAFCAVATLWVAARER